MKVLEIPSLELSVALIPKNGTTFFRKFLSSHARVAHLDQTSMSHIAVPLRDPQARLLSAIVEVFFRWSPIKAHGRFQIHYPNDPFRGLRGSFMRANPVLSVSRAIDTSGYFDKHLVPVSHYVTEAGTMGKQVSFFALTDAQKLMEIAGLPPAQSDWNNSWLQPNVDRDDLQQTASNLLRHPGLLIDRTLVYSLRNPLAAQRPFRNVSLVLRKVARQKGRALSGWLAQNHAAQASLACSVRVQYQQDAELWTNLQQGHLPRLPGLHHH